MSIDPHHLKLFVTGDAPRSRRARTHLAEVLEQSGLDPAAVHEIDLSADPVQTLTFGIFATPALLRTSEAGDTEVLYGDLSERRALERFLALG
jgi:circadian clock protein KaiB